MESFKLGEVEGHWSRAGDHDLLSFLDASAGTQMDVEVRTGTGA